MISTRSIEELVVNKYLCESSNLNFTRYFFRHRFGRKFIVNEHHQIICDALDKVISGEIKKLIINIAPRYGKTELAVKNFMAHGLAVNPAARFIHLSYSDDLALDNSEEVKDIIKSPEYQELFPKVKIKPRSDSKKKWYTTENGGVYATSTAGQVTGFGAGTVDVEDMDMDMDFMTEGTGIFSGAMIIDDPIKPEDADSQVTRTRINERWDSTIKNRVNSRNTPIIIIMQRLHEEDLCGYIMQQSPGDWTILSLPSIKPDGTALWPFKHTIEELHKLRRENELVFERQHMQDPKPLKGHLFQRATTKRFTRTEFEKIRKKVRTVMGYIDPSEGGGDALAFPLGHIMPGAVYITDVVYSHDTVDVTIPLCVDQAERNNANYVRIEKNGLGSGYIRDMRREWKEERVLQAKSTTHKGTRIWNEYGFISTYFHFLAEGEYEPGSHYDKFMRNLFSYMKVGENQQDGAPDACAGLSRFIQSWPGTAKLFDKVSEGPSDSQ